MKTLTSSRYIELPPEERPAMQDVDAIALYQDFVQRRLPAPEEVKIEAHRQANKEAPSGWIVIFEEYHGRLRAISMKK